MTTASDGKTYNIKHYNLEIVILIGNKIDQKKTSEFKEYIVDIIKEYKKAHKRYEIVKFINKTLENSIEIDVNVDPSEETVWLKLEDISILFERDRTVISKHIKNIYQNNELEEQTTCAKNAHMGINSVQKYENKIYNLDVILAVGYRVNSIRGTMFRKWANKILKQYLMKGYVINPDRVTVTKSNFQNLVNEVNVIETNQINLTNIMNETKKDLDNRLKIVEDKVLEKEHGLDKILYNGQFYDAYSLIQKIFESASNEIIIIDNYVDRSVLDRLVVKKQNVKVNIHTNINTVLLGRDINTFNNQYGGLNVLYTTKVHDRYIVIGNNDLYLVGGSIKNLGKRITTVVKLDNKLINTIINNI